MTPTLGPDEARVLGVLVEKQATVPDTYPLSLAALVAGCNQKTARAPVLELRDADVLTAIDGLKSLSLVIESSGTRVARYEHNLSRALRLPGAAVALLAVLMLRGAQTAAELRANAERLHRFADVSSVEGFLDELAAREPPLAVKLARMPGEREARWAQCLTGAPAVAAAPLPACANEPGAAAGLDELRAAQDALAAEVAALRERLDALTRRVDAAWPGDAPAGGGELPAGAR